MRVQLAGTTFDFNIRENLYYDSYRGAGSVPHLLSWVVTRIKAFERWER